MGFLWGVTRCHLFLTSAHDPANGREEGGWGVSTGWGGSSTSTHTFARKLRPAVLGCMHV